ncbi:hypothetical protein FHL06_07545 [Lactobacillus halodurans]|uniref:Uncharacterized protein n=1 Tax=Companilactobacillus halodurans TaxID=2584183 RepID=A0A5P0ZQ45_9LACO|nr:hypothetical protein [Companilactobacillus halodurans]MQS76239.1 hypothetical protein [Companilactobacillus halodurans]
MEMLEPINTDYSYGHLTKVQRAEIIKKLTESQKQTIEQYKRYKVNSMLLNQFNKTGTEWKFLEEKINWNFNQSNPNESNLHCSCGRGVKYLYVCKSKNNQEIKCFGKNHLEQEAGIGSNVLQDIRKEKHKIDRGLDEILIRVDGDVFFPTEPYEFLKKNRMLDILFSKERMEYLKEFSREGLPIYREDENKMIKEFNRILEKVKEQKHQKWLKTTEGIQYLKEQVIKKKYNEEQEIIRIERQKIWLNNNDWFNEQKKFERKSDNKETTIFTLKKRTIDNAKVTFNQVLIHHNDVTEKYCIESNCDMDALIINGMFDGGSVTNGKTIIPQETVIRLLKMLNKKFEYDINGLEKRVDEIYGILEHEGIIKKSKNRFIANY